MASLKNQSAKRAWKHCARTAIIFLKGIKYWFELNILICFSLKTINDWSPSSWVCIPKKLSSDELVWHNFICMHL